MLEDFIDSMNERKARGRAVRHNLQAVEAFLDMMTVHGTGQGYADPQRETSRNPAANSP